MATIQDVAKAAGVSAMTVSNVINDHPNVRRATREKVLQAMSDDWNHSWKALGDPEHDSYGAQRRIYALFGLDVTASPFVGTDRVNTASCWKRRMTAVGEQGDQKRGPAGIQVDRPGHRAVLGQREDVPYQGEQFGFVIEDSSGQQLAAVQVDHRAVMSGLAGIRSGP